MLANDKKKKKEAVLNKERRREEKECKKHEREKKKGTTRRKFHLTMKVLSQQMKKSANSLIWVDCNNWVHSMCALGKNKKSKHYLCSE